MRWNQHSKLAGLHAVLSASKYHWINYDDDKLVAYINKLAAARRGTELHELAKDLIRLGIKLPRTSKTLNLYVNDMIGFKMEPEMVLFYSDNIFGTADGIGFDEKKMILRIADLKTGDSITSEHQLEVYAALFCHEYHYKPYELNKIELLIYQNDEVRIYEADPGDIVRIMDKMVHADRLLQMFSDLD